MLVNLELSISYVDFKILCNSYQIFTIYKYLNLFIYYKLTFG